MRLTLATLILVALAGTAAAQESTMIHSVDENGAGYQFVPASVEVSPGSEIVLMNVGQEPHKMKANDGSFESPTAEASPPGLPPNPQSTVTFQAPTQPGEYPYFCPFHGEGMSGVIVVREGASGGQSATMPPTTTTTATPTGAAGGNDSPGLSVLAVGLALVGAAILVARRQR